jgi:predicted small lipoprotein YifL
MPTRISVVLFALFFSLSGCGQDYNLAPPPDSEQMTVTVKVPEELEAETLEVMYRSSICKRIKHGSSGQRVEVEGYHGVNVKLQREGQTDLYSTKLPMDGGGACKWHLSNITFGVAYINPARFGEGVTYGAGGGVVVMFDRNRPSLSPGLPIKVDGDLIIKKEYYPWLGEAFLGGHRKQVSLAGESGIYIMYQALQARSVYFEPVYHSKFIVYSVQPKEKIEGSHTVFTYPDGSVVANGQSKPDFRKLQAIRLATERQK